MAGQVAGLMVVEEEAMPVNVPDELPPNAVPVDEPALTW